MKIIQSYSPENALDQSNLNEIINDPYVIKGLEEEVVALEAEVVVLQAEVVELKQKLSTCEDQLPPPPEPPSTDPVIDKFILINGHTQAEMGEIINGQSLLVGSVINIQATVKNTVTKVVFDLAGAEVYNRTEGVAPYALKGDSGGVYESWIPTVGEYILTATPFNGDVVGASKVVVFKVVADVVTPPEPPTPDFEIDWNDPFTLRQQSAGYQIQGWELPSYIKYISLSNDEASKQFATETLVGADGAKMMKLHAINDDPNKSGTSRAQMGLRIQENLDVIKYEQRMILHNDFSHLESYPKSFHWLMLHEIWLERMADSNSSGSMRWSLYVQKETTGKLFWQLRIELTPSGSYINLGRFTNKEVEVPIGKWYTWRFEILKNEGIIRAYVKVDGQQEQTIFDLKDAATKHPDNPSLIYHALSPYKVYADDVIMDFMRKAGKELSVTYDGFKLWKSLPPTPEPQPETYFEGNFVGGSLSSDGKKIAHWEAALQAIPEYNSQLIATNANGSQYLTTDIRKDPETGKEVLYFEMIQDDPNVGGQARTQWGLYMDSVHGRKEFLHTQNKLKLSPDYADIKNFSKRVHWNQIMELWHEGFYPKEQGGEMGGSARWKLNIIKDEGIGQPLYWEYATEYMQPPEKKFQAMFPKQFNKTHPVENYLGRWIVFDYYFHRNGRTIVKLDGDVIFDFVGQNTYPGKPELYQAVVSKTLGQYAKINQFKIYTQNDLLLFLKSRGKKLWHMYDDFKWFKL